MLVTTLNKCQNISIEKRTIASTQCNLKLCNMALVPSIITNTTIVQINQNPNKMTIAMTPMVPVNPKAMARVIDQRTMESCA